jgi:hypothetical protein
VIVSLALDTRALRGAFVSRLAHAHVRGVAELGVRISAAHVANILRCVLGLVAVRVQLELDLRDDKALAFELHGRLSLHDLLLLVLNLRGNVSGLKVRDVISTIPRESFGSTAVSLSGISNDSVLRVFNRLGGIHLFLEVLHFVLDERLAVEDVLQELQDDLLDTAGLLILGKLLRG